MDVRTRLPLETKWGLQYKWFMEYLPLFNQTWRTAVMKIFTIRSLDLDKIEKWLGCISLSKNDEKKCYFLYL